MDGVHNLGGVEGFGPIPIREGDKDFVDLEDWEKRMLALQFSPIAPGTTLDWFRHGIELMVPADYLSLSYFNKWCANAFVMMIDNGTITMEDVKRGHIQEPQTPPKPLLLSDVLADEASCDFSFERANAVPPAFAVGDTVTMRSRLNKGHTRLPRYVQGRSGKVVAHHGSHVLPDQSARGIETAEHLYTVVFNALELWGGDANPLDDVTLDLWESYFVPA